jgi:3-dehydroquinate synthetase/ABC-type uncharacterized transport system YnjBCD ATPase subunit
VTKLQIRSFALQRPDGSTPFLSLPEEGLTFPLPGVYTLEGPNQSGKSTFLKALVGALPASIDLIGEADIAMDGDQFRALQSPADAAQAGVIGVFQDDLLIPSLPVLEQLVLRHGRLKSVQFWNYARIRIYDFIIHPIAAIAGLFSREGSVRISSFFHPKRVNWLQTADIEESARRFLAEIHDGGTDILAMVPAQLSGGRKALTKVLALDIYFERQPPPRVLLLDEAFSGMQRDLWPLLLARYRRWAQEKSGIIIAVTHNQAELDLWQPIARLRIESGRLSSLSPPSPLATHRGIPDPVATFDILRIDRADARERLSEFLTARIHADSRVVVIVSPHCEGTPPFTQMMDVLIEGRSHAPLVVSLGSRESETHLAGVVPILEKLVVHLKDDSGVIIVVGGGSTINLGGFLASILFRGVCRTIVVPTTVLAIADVVVGSKTSVPLKAEGANLPAPLNIKHSIGTYHNPSSAIIDPRYVDNLSIGETIIGFSEVIKHGILQDGDLFDKGLGYVLGSLAPLDLEATLGHALPPGSRNMAVALAERTSLLKGEVLALDPFEKDYGKTLLFGHLHAHCLERVTGFRIPHGVAVYLGMLIDLVLADNSALVTKLSPVLRGSRLRWLQPLNEMARDDLQSVYKTQNKRIHGVGDEYTTLRLVKVGEFSLQEISKSAVGTGVSYDIDPALASAEYTKERELRVNFDQIWTAISTLFSEIEIP